MDSRSPFEEVDRYACSDSLVTMIAVDDRTDRKMTGRVIRPGQPEPPDLDWQTMSIEQRIEAVWELTKLSYAWNHDDPGALRLQRSVVHVQRPRR